MCGIIGFCGKGDPVPILMNGLAALEYRGYDSAGIAVYDGEKMTVEKEEGKIENLKKRLEPLPPFKTDSPLCGIGHTRWATHGAPSRTNAHPHLCASLALVHNGIIENCEDIRRTLTGAGYTFVSDTDTEVAAGLIDYHYRACHSPVKAIFEAVAKMRGSYAFGIIFNDFPATLFAVRKDSPLIISRYDGKSYISSDLTALPEDVKEYVRLDENVCAVISPSEVKFYAKGEVPTSQKWEPVVWNESRARHDGYKHFMLKEINEIPDCLRRTANGICKRDGLSFGAEMIDSGELQKRLANGGIIHIVACGTAMHAGLVGKYLIEKFAKVRVNVEVASEFRYKNPILNKNDAVILLSQSGETADTLAGLRYAKARGLYTLAIVNVPGSSISLEADNVIYTPAGPEIAVASTKAYHVQCAVLTLLALKLATDAKCMPLEKSADIAEILNNDIPHAVKKICEDSESLKKIALKIKDSEHIFFIGRGIDSVICVEGSLKLKEISYIHSEAYPAGELKHGTISLISDGTPVIACMTDAELYEKTLSAIREVKSRGAYVTAFVSEDILALDDGQKNKIPADDLVKVPTVREGMSFYPAVAAMQLLAYHTSDSLGLDVDKPRNLAKSVTVE